jgi:hypothetical protein
MVVLEAYIIHLKIEDLNLNPAVSVLLLFASSPDGSQNQTAVSDTLRLLFDFGIIENQNSNFVKLSFMP